MHSRLNPPACAGPRQVCGPARSAVVRVSARATASVIAARGPGNQLVSSQDEWYTPGHVPERLIGPIKVTTTPGSGRGVVATEAVAAGQLLLVTHPLALAHSNGAWQPYLEALTQHLAAMPLTEPQQQWLDTLFNGMPKSTRRIPDLSTPAAPPPTPRQHPTTRPNPTSPAAPSARTPQPPATNTSTSASTSSAAPRVGGPRKKAGAASSKPRESQQQKQEKRVKQLQQVVNYNAYGEKHEDMAAGALRGEPPRGMLGLWPEFSMFNHSCAPNAINLTLGGTMVVRAVRPIAAGQEVTISYLGRPQLLPLEARREHLRSSHGFSCTCPRCEGEASRWDELGPLCEAAHELATGELQGSAMQAAAEGDEEELREARRLLRAAVQRMHSMFRKALVSPQVRRWCHASMYHCLELLEDVEACLGEDTAWVTKLCLEAMAEVSPGSDLHTILAARHWQQQRALEEAQQAQQGQHGGQHDGQRGEQGPPPQLQPRAAGVAAGAAGLEAQGQGRVPPLPEAHQAYQVCAAAHRLRYGNVSDGLLRQLVEQNQELCGTWNRAVLAAM